MWLCEAYLDGKLVARSYEDNIEWFKSAHSCATNFRFCRVS